MSRTAGKSPRGGLPRRTLTSLCLLGLILLGSIHAGIKIREYGTFTSQAVRLMSDFTTDLVAGRPLDAYQASFAVLEHSDRALGRMVAIAYRERTGSLQQRDTSIVAAVNSLNGKDLYKLLTAAKPLFEPSAREAYLEGRPGTLGFPGVDMRFDTLSAEQKQAMLGCLNQLQSTYGGNAIASRIMVALELYIGMAMDTCTVPAKRPPISLPVPLNQTV